jgi:hypothetical protein
VPGLPDGFFSNQKNNLGKFWRALDLKMLLYFMAIWNILQTFGILYDHLVHFVFVRYIFSGFGIMCEEKSGNPDPCKVFSSHEPGCNLELVKRNTYIQSFSLFFHACEAGLPDFSGFNVPK